MSEETKDCARLPVVAYVHPLYLKPNALGFEASACRLAAAQVGLCLADDAQALLAQKNARIAQLAAHARGKNKALANALKEIERLNDTVARLSSSLVSAGDDPFWKEKLAIIFCEQRGIVEGAPDHARAVDAFISGLAIGSKQAVSARDAVDWALGYRGGKE